MKLLNIVIICVALSGMPAAVAASVWHEPAPHMLHEVEVTGRRPAFYHVGDTIVFPAASYVHDDGDMVDALFIQLPGVRLMADGRFTFNGRPVDMLLLDGSDILGGRPRLLLDNIRANMVRGIKYYERPGRRSRDMQMQLPGDTEHVLDIILKKEYATGLIANVGGGYGTDNRYAGRGFLLNYDDTFKISASANANNLSDESKPGETDGLRLQSSPRGRMQNQLGALDYSYEPSRRMSVSGQADFVRNVVDDEETSLWADLLPQPDGGDVVSGCSADVAHRENVRFSTSHTLGCHTRRMSLSVSPQFDYTGATSDSRRSERTFMGGRELNNAGRTDGSDSRYLHGLLAVDFARMFDGGHSLEISARADYNAGRTHSRSRNEVKYADGLVALDELQYRESALRPDKRFAGNLSIGYNSLQQFSRPGIPMFSLRYELEYERAISRTKAMLDGLPDAASSPVSRQSDMRHLLHFNLNWQLERRLSVLLHGRVGVERQQLDYSRAPIDTAAARIVPHLAPVISLSYKVGADYTLSARYSYANAIPALLSTVGWRDDTNPLVVYEGNPGLKSSAMHRASFGFSQSDYKRQLMQDLSLNVTLARRPMVTSEVFDSSTGVRILSRANASDEYSLSVSHALSLVFGHENRWRFNSLASLSAGRSSALLRMQAGSVFSEVYSRDYGVSLQPELSCRLWSRTQLAFKCRYRYSCYSDPGSVRLFDATHVLTVNTPIVSTLKLKADVETLTRRGYYGGDMNRTRVLLNAGLSYTLCGGRLSLMLDARDILGQLSNDRVTVTPLRLTETTRNSLSRYALLHVRWMFNRRPAQRK